VAGSKALDSQALDGRASDRDGDVNTSGGTGAATVEWTDAENGRFF